MFKLESYITPILLSYVDKYIKNFKLEDSQVSLWGGDASFHNLDLRLEVLEQELYLPFSFVSGHIHELLIHVPWTKLTSEPITITINTIECILKLRDTEAQPGASDSKTQSPREKIKKTNQRDDESTVEAPPGYVQTLINKIVNNIRICCNNLILKYVEEDIVLSTNVKLLNFMPADEHWEAAYTAAVTLRKLILLNDLTICLDKRNAAGKIEVYQEPMLYRCSVTIHLLRFYHSATAKRPTTTRLDMYCNNMEFSITEQQVPMVIRLMELVMALREKDFKPLSESQLEDISHVSLESDSIYTPDAQGESWAGWAWSFVPSILPASDEYSNEEPTAYAGHTMQVGFYVDDLSVTFKVSETSNDRGYYAQRKLKYWPLLSLYFQGLYTEVIMQGLTWFNMTFGISEVILVPVGYCSCSHQEIHEGGEPPEYLKIGYACTSHKSDSLFDAEAVENKGQRKMYRVGWDYHTSTVTESVLLERTPAFAIDYICELDKPDDITSEKLSEMSTKDLEYSNVPERSLTRYVIGPARVLLCSGFLHRISSLQVAASAYDYAPYIEPKPELVLSELLPPSEEDYDALLENIPMMTTQYTIFAPVLELQLMDHPFFEATKGNLFRKRKKLSTSVHRSKLSSKLPKMTVECQCIDLKTIGPMYNNRLVYTVCQLPEKDVPKHMFEACFSNSTLKVLGLCSRLILASNRHTTIITPSSISYNSKTIAKPHLWINPEIPHNELTFESESFTLTATRAKVMVIKEILNKFMNQSKVEPFSGPLFNSSLLQDATRDCALPYLEVSIEGIRFKQVTTFSTQTYDTSLGAIKVFVFDPIQFRYSSSHNLQNSLVAQPNTGNQDWFCRSIEQVLIFSGPETTKGSKDSKSKSEENINEDVALLTATLQFPIGPDKQVHPPILIFNLQEVKVCIDPLLCSWLLYSPKKYNVKQSTVIFDPMYHQKRALSEASGSVLETPRRAGTPHESIHSSSDRDVIYVPQRFPKGIKEIQNVDMQDRTFNFLKKWFDIWKGMVICGNISQCTLYFPTGSLSAEGYQGIQEAISEAVNKEKSPDILVLTLPNLSIRSSSHKQNLSQYVVSLPVTLPEAIWTPDRCSFPWTLSVVNFSCFSLSGKSKLHVLDSVSLTATIALSTRPYKNDGKPPTDSGPECSAETSRKSDVGSIGICVHIDMTPINIILSESQICLVGSILFGLVDVLDNLTPEEQKETIKMPEIIPPAPSKVSTSSPTVLKESTLDSISEKTPPGEIQDKLTENDIKLTAWIQWTITKFSVEILSYDKASSVLQQKEGPSNIPNVKLVMVVEDIVSSLDFQSVYLKIKSKIGSANIHHFARNAGKKNSAWKPGPFLGMVMKVREESGNTEGQEDTSFASLTITRASCQHTHSLWGAVKKRKGKVDFFMEDEPKAVRYITEIVARFQPVDFIISMATLRTFYAAVEPLFDANSEEQSATKTTSTNTSSSYLLTLNNQNLPLIYLESKGLRIIVPTADIPKSNLMHDFYMLQYESINVSPAAVNPIIRAPLRPDIYQQAAQARILNIPGSEVEDRQYEINITGTSVHTGLWTELDKFLNVRTTSHHLKTMNENPALEWNNLEKSGLKAKPHLNLCPVIRKFDLCVVIAPPMVYKKDTMVCGHSVEINFVTDIEVNLSINQIKLSSALFTEFLQLFEPFYTDEGISRRPRIILPYPKFTYLLMDEDEEVDLTRDSGFETSDLRSVSPKTYAESTMTLPHYQKYFDFPRSHASTVADFASMDLLFTGGKFSFVLYELEGPFEKKKQGSKRQFAWRSKEVETRETGYDASEEGSIDEKIHTSNTYNPLLFFSISQPNAFLSRQQLSRKIQLSFFDVNIKINSPESASPKDIPGEDNFPIDFLKTKVGCADPDTGIPPAFMSVKFLKNLGKPAFLDMNFSRPVRLFASLTRWSYLLMIRDKLLASVKPSIDSIKPQEQAVVKVESNTSTQTETFHKFTELKERLFNISNLNFKSSQIMFAYKTQRGSELTLCMEGLKSHLQIVNRPEKINNLLSVECFTIGVSQEGFHRLLLNPLTISLDVCLYWEQWLGSNSFPQVHAAAESDCIMVDISSKTMKIVDTAMMEFEEHFGKEAEDGESTKDSEPAEKVEEKQEFVPSNTTKEQYYKDDLRAGAFQFVDASISNTEELPLPYQVIFWNRNIAAMAWRYPQPRALTKVRVFPVPFKFMSNTEEDQQVLCHLEYYSECQNCYLPYTQFYLSESVVAQLELPEGNPKTIVASIWRVVLTTPGSKWQNIDFDFSTSIISPRALAACMRIDSYFNRNLVPDLTVSLHISNISLSFYNHFNKSMPAEVPECLVPFTCDMNFPEAQLFCTLHIDNVRGYMNSWKFTSALIDVSATMQCLVLDYKYLSQQVFLVPFSSKLEISYSEDIKINYISKPIHINFGPSIAHTLAISAQQWQQILNPMPNETRTLIVMTRYVICNDTTFNLRFGQATTDEDILLPSRYCHFYCWRSPKYKPMLRLGLEENGWTWSKPFNIDAEGTQMYHLSDSSSTVVVTIKDISNTQKQIIFSGQLIISNMLQEHFEMKVVRAEVEDKDREFRMAPSYLASGNSNPPSLLIDTKEKYFLRLRFFGLESAWSGDIPLMENTKCTQPWLVKVPLQERGRFLSIWCKIVVQNFKDGAKILAVLWPLFMVRSNLPVSSKVRIETPTLNVQIDSTVKGRGEYQQLYCPGTIDHSHQLSFQLMGSTTQSNPYVPLNYSLVDQKLFFKKSEKEDINQILAVLKNYNQSKWPYFADDYDAIDWIAEDQPLTHVQVRYQNVCQHSSCLLVELLPWCLLVNMLGCHICIIINEKEQLQVCHHGIVTPPKLEETFHIGVSIGSTWNMSPPLQLAISDWGPSFYMPTITGTIPLEGTIKTTVRCNSSVIMMAVTSTITNEIRLLKVSSTHVLTSHLSMNVRVCCLAVSESLHYSYNIPEIINDFTFLLPPQMDKKEGVSLLQWFIIEDDEDSSSEFVLYITFCLDPAAGWSCPVRVDKIVPRKSISIKDADKSVPVVLASQEYKGQIYLSLHEDINPQLLIKNFSGTSLYCGQFADGSINYVARECKHFNWKCYLENGRSHYYTMPGISDRFPDISPNSYPDQMCLAADPLGEADGYQWSSPIKITNFTYQYVRIPAFGDVKVTLYDSANTILMVIESVSEMEISAKDIRVRLSLRNSSSDVHKIKHLENENPESSGTTINSFISAADSIKSKSSTNVSTSFGMPTLTEISALSVDGNTSSFNPSVGKSADVNLLSVNVFVKSVTVTLTSDLEGNEAYHTEVANFTFDNIAASFENNQETNIVLSFSDIQFDNQMYNQGQYDFPVILIGQEQKPNHKLISLNTPIKNWINFSRENAVVALNLSLEKKPNDQSLTDFKDLKISIKPLSVFIEDSYVTKLMEYLKTFTPTELVVWTLQRQEKKRILSAGFVIVPEVVLWESLMYTKPLSLRNLSIEPVSILFSIHSSIKLYIALDKSPLHFGQFERRRLLTTSYKLGHALTMQYLTGAIFGAGWIVGSLELIGSPGGLARAMGTGLRDFISLPYYGLVQGPWAFLIGVTNGSASLMKHVTAGTLQSVTKLASSVARNLDRLTLDEEHLRRAEELRRLRPQGLTEGFVQGLTGLGISLLGAVGGIAHHPLQSVMAEGASPRSLAAGVGLGIVGMFTKPLSGAAELVALTGQGLLQGAGWNPLPEPRLHPVLNHTTTNSILKYAWKYMQQITQSDIYFVAEATVVSNAAQYEAVALILTSDGLVIINTDEDTVERIVNLNELITVRNSNDPTLLSFKIVRRAPPIVQQKSIDDDCIVEMDPARRARVADYVRSTNGILLLPDEVSLDPSEMSISPIPTPDVSVVNEASQEEVLVFYVNPLYRNYFLCLFSVAKQQSESSCFCVL